MVKCYFSWLNIFIRLNFRYEITKGVKMKTSFFFTVFTSIVLFCSFSNAQNELISFESSVADIYKGNIEDAADYIAEFPSNAEAEQILNNLNSISEEIRGMLYGDIPAEPDRINEIRSYVLKTFRETELLQWNLLHIYEHQSIHLLPGEGIILTLKSYCLDHSAASPAPDEFYYIDEIPSEQAEWLTPIMNYITKQPGKEFPVQGLIWNMNKEVAFNDLPPDQQDLFRSAVPDAEERYGKDIIDKGVEAVLDLFGREVKEEVEPVSDAIEVIDDISEIEAEIENKISELKLLIPQYDTYQLHNGLLVRAKSTGSYKSIILTIVNPKSNDFGLKFYVPRNAYFASKNNDATTYDAKDMVINKMIPYVIGKWGDRLKKAKGFSDKCLDAKDKLQEIDDFIEDPDGYVKGRGFNEGLDFFKAGIKGNKKAEEAFELFRKFNLDLLDSKKDKSERPGKKGGKSMKPSDFKFKPGRDDVQPLGCKFGC